jgi:lipopolysaccharide heptosyltransferase II
MSASRQRLRLALLRAFAALSWPLIRRRAPALPAAPRILLIRPDHVGDLLFATPALRALREALPDAHLACMVGPWGQAVLAGNPNLDEIIVCEFPAFTRKPKVSLLAPYRLLRTWAASLRSLRFDMAIVLRFDHWWAALLAYLAGIPSRVGYDISECRPFLTQALPYANQRHEVLQNWTLVEQAVKAYRDEAFGRVSSLGPRISYPGHGSSNQKATWDCLAPTEFAVLPKDQEHIARYLARGGVTVGQDLVAIHPGAGAAVKLWRAEAWAQVADALIHRWRVGIVITGSGDELDLAWSVYARMHSHATVAAGDTTLGQLAALFQRCRVVIGPDCGPLHLAVATGAPTVHLYGPVDPVKFGPWGDPEKHLVLTSDRDCIPCNRLDYSAQELPSHPCVREITAEAVLEAAQRLLQRT